MTDSLEVDSQSEAREFFEVAELADVNKYRSRMSEFGNKVDMTVSDLLLLMKSNVGGSALHAAASHGNLRVMKCMLLQQPKLINMTDNEGNTALHLSAKGQNSAVVSFLLEASEPDARYQLNSDLQSPLFLSLYTALHSNFQILIEDAHWDEVRHMNVI